MQVLRRLGLLTEPHPVPANFGGLVSTVLTRVAQVDLLPNPKSSPKYSFMTSSPDINPPSGSYASALRPTARPIMGGMGSKPKSWGVWSDISCSMRWWMLFETR